MRGARRWCRRFEFGQSANLKRGIGSRVGGRTGAGHPGQQNGTLHGPADGVQYVCVLDFKDLGFFLFSRFSSGTSTKVQSWGLVVFFLIVVFLVFFFFSACRVQEQENQKRQLCDELEQLKTPQDSREASCQTPVPEEEVRQEVGQVWLHGFMVVVVLCCPSFCFSIKNNILQCLYRKQMIKNLNLFSAHFLFTIFASFPSFSDLLFNTST